MLDSSLAVSAQHSVRNFLAKQSSRANGGSAVNAFQRAISREFCTSKSIDIEFSRFRDRLAALPQEWTLNWLSLSPDRKHLLISRVRNSTGTVFLRLPLSVAHRCGPRTSVGTSCKSDEGLDYGDLQRSFDVIMAANKTTTAAAAQATSEETRADWWEKRHAIDVELQSLLRTMEASWLGVWRGTLLGRFANADVENEVAESASAIAATFPCGLDSKSPSPSSLHLRTSDERAALIGCLLSSAVEGKLSEPELLEASWCLLGSQGASASAAQISSALSREATRISEKYPGDSLQRCPTFLFLDEALLEYPWESLPCLRPHTVCRLPSIAFLSARIDPQVLELHCSRAVAIKDGCLSHFNSSEAFYVLNPGSDLPRTQAQFEETFRDSGWTGIVGQAPSASELQRVLTELDLFVYVGHGAGERYLSSQSVATQRVQAVGLLMGCSSGRLAFTAGSEFEPHGMVLAYLMGGCPAVVANLWDVTDKDIDRFSHRLFGPLLPQSTNTSRSKTNAAMELKQARKRELKPFHEKSNDSKSSNSKIRAPVADTLPVSRDVCKLGFLIGAAPVYYGIPVRFGIDLEAS